MAEYIEREAINRICFMDYFLVDGEVRTESVALVRDIEKLPAADVAPVVHGDWIPCFDDEDRWRQGFAQCSNCGGEYYACTIHNLSYCPNCGARMDGGMSE